MYIFWGWHNDNDDNVGGNENKRYVATSFDDFVILDDGIECVSLTLLHLARGKS